jgi:predicted phosphodiesterase
LKIKKHQRAIVIPDQHYPLHDQKAVNCVLKAIRLVKPNIFINLGDCGEWSSVSHWNWKRKKKPPMEYLLPIIKDEIRQVNDGIDQMTMALDHSGCNERYMLTGNHDHWLNQFVEAYPYLDEYTFENACRLRERGYKTLPHNEPLKIGKLLFIHGAYVCLHHAKKHLAQYGMSIMYGHTHDIQRFTHTRHDNSIGAWSMGCLKKMDSESNEWLSGRLHNWGHCFGIVDFFPDGNFKVEVVEIIDGTTSVWGDVING